MAEPKIGMKFSTMDTLSKKAYKKAKRKGGDLYVATTLDGVRDYNRKFYIVNAGKASQKTIAKSTIEQHETDEHLLRGCFIQNGLKYTGVVEQRPDESEKDIRFTSILGMKTYAKDINGNGKVDKGEIFELDFEW